MSHQKCGQSSPSFLTVASYFPNASFCSGTKVIISPFSTADRRLFNTKSSISRCVSYVMVPMCGSSITLGLLTKPGSISGSFS